MLNHQPKGEFLTHFTLYGTSACHLCEIAKQMLQLQQKSQQRAGTALDFDQVDISESDTLFERYGVLIPVLQHPDGRELNWPFSRSQLERFLAS
ncbi:MAG: glutaredoxin family protein [Gammaproteobacteria bacterium]|nr:MAG: glutaredoxin family protein [Gammaproteobacteria bacterium]RLA62337.1 MAG: glutaredoxin family protein [Gammaproteobacteria bacterium]